jgi:hypothetical protein
VPATPISAAGAASAVAPADIETWLTDLGIVPGPRLERDGAAAWDLVLDGRRRFDIRATVFLDPAVGAVAWIHYAPPLSDQIRKTYRRLLRWNDSFPFAKFALADDERPILEAEVPLRWLDGDEVGLALARLVAICDLLVDESVSLIWSSGRQPPIDGRVPRNPLLLDRYADRLAELSVG